LDQRPETTNVETTQRASVDKIRTQDMERTWSTHKTRTTTVQKKTQIVYTPTKDPLINDCHKDPHDKHEPTTSNDPSEDMMK